MSAGTTPSPTQQILAALSAAVNTIVKDAEADELAALKAPIITLGTGLASNPDLPGLQALGAQFVSGVIAAQVTVKGNLTPQVGAIIVALGNSL